MSVLNNLNKLLHSRFPLSLFFIISFTLFPIISDALSATYYVDATNGNDYYSGLSQSTPWKTIAKVNASKFNPGDQIFFKRGEIWREQFTVPSSGSSGSPITIGAYGTGVNPIITGFDVMKGFSHAAGDPINLYNRTGITTRPYVVAYNGTLLKYNHIGVAIGTNEWDWNNNVLYINVGAHPSGGTVEAGQRSYAISATQLSYITIQDLTLTGANTHSVRLLANGGTMANIILQGLTIFNSYDGIRTSGTAVAGPISILNNTIHHLYEYGIGINTPNASGYLIQGNTIYNVGNPQIGVDTNMQGIYMAAPNAIIELNHIYNIGSAGTLDDGAHNHAIYFQGGTGGYTVRRNLTHDVTGCGVITGGCNNCTINYNVIYHAGTAGLYIDNTQSSSYLYFYNNTVSYSGSRTYGGGGFFLQPNVIADHITLKNNIFYNNTAMAAKWPYTPQEKYQIYFNAGTITNLVSDYNLLYYSGVTNIANYSGTPYTWATWQGAGYDTHGVNADPKVVSTSTPDFRLQSSSPAINAGTNVGLTQDYDGNSVPQGSAPDIGAYEFLAPSLRPVTGLRIIK